MGISGANNSDEACAKYPEICPEAKFYPKVFGAVGGTLLSGGLVMIFIGSRPVPLNESATLRLMPWASPRASGLTMQVEL
jgi:hypothetical protein